jgi:hypothetical protein
LAASFISAFAKVRVAQRGPVVPASVAGAMSVVQHANALTGRAAALMRDDAARPDRASLKVEKSRQHSSVKGLRDPLHIIAAPWA